MLRLQTLDAHGDNKCVTIDRDAVRCLLSTSTCVHQRPREGDRRLPCSLIEPHLKQPTVGAAEEDRGDDRLSERQWLSREVPWYTTPRRTSLGDSITACAAFVIAMSYSYSVAQTRLLLCVRNRGMQHIMMRREAALRPQQRPKHGICQTGFGHAAR